MTSNWVLSPHSPSAAATKLVRSASKGSGAEPDRNRGEHRFRRALLHPLAADRVLQPAEIERARTAAAILRHRPLERLGDSHDRGQAIGRGELLDASDAFGEVPPGEAFR